MIELSDRADKYASGKSNAIIDKAIAQAYADGYRDGYKDREEEIPVGLRDNKMEFEDLGLPSGTLWSADYERNGDDYFYAPYDKAVLFGIPTKEQWTELFTTCKLEYVKNSAHDLYRIDCTGPNGRVISFCTSGLINAKQLNKQNEAYFWIKEEIEGNYKYAVHMSRQSNVIQNKKYFIDNTVVEKTFSGYKLPIRLARTK